MLSIKEIKLLIKNKKARDQQGLFVTEGRKLFEEAPKDRIVQVLMTADYEREHSETDARIPKDVPVLRDMEKGRFASLCDTKSPQGILTVVRRRDGDVRTVLEANEKHPFYVVLENLQDPGNAGTIIRTAEAAGVSAVFLTKGSVDLYSPKTIRSTMGSIYRVPHFYVDDLPELFSHFHKRHVKTYAAHLRGDRAYTDCDFTGGTALIIGNEGNGITDDTADAADVLMKIPMSGQVESLNAAMAAGILMYEVKRQRRL